MKKFFSALISLILVVAIVGVVFVFAFEKKIPTAWVKIVVEAAKADKFPEEDQLPREMKLFYEEISYSKDGNKTVKTYNSKAMRQVYNKTTEEAEAYEVKCIDYDSNGAVSEQWIIKYYMEDGQRYKEEKDRKFSILNYDEVKSLYDDAIADYYEDDLTLKIDIKNMIDCNLDYVSQKGLNITLHLVKDNEKLNITYNVGAKRIVKFEQTVDTYTDNVLSKRVHNVVEF